MEMTDLEYALKMYGRATLDYAKLNNPSTYDNMVFWQNQVWLCAKEQAEQENKPTIY